MDVSFGGLWQICNGMIWNIDFFFKDDIVEMKKMILILNFFCDDNQLWLLIDFVMKDLKFWFSLDKLDKEFVFDKEKKKFKEKEKCEKDKKLSVI